MEFTRTKPTGVDIHIQKLQSFLYAQTKALWSLSDDDFDGYGRVYKNQTADGIIPEAYISDREYRDTLFDDRKKAISFFGVGDNISYNGATATAQIFVIYLVNLGQIKGGDQQRADEEARVDIQKLLQPGRYGTQIVSFETGIDAVFREFSGFRKDKGMKYRDLQPFHVFRVNLSLAYNILDC